MMVMVIVLGIGIFWQLTKEVPGYELNQYSELFQSEIIQAGVERGGHPIEGFSAFIFMQIFPDLVPSDFGGVKTLEGVYHFDGNELTYQRTAGQPVTSAEQTISSEGYRTLLANLSKRLEVEVKSESDVATLLAVLTQNEEREGEGKDIKEINGDEDGAEDEGIADVDDDVVMSGGGGILPFDSGVSGRVLLGPTCPVMREPPDPGCADKPYPTTVEVYAIGSHSNAPFSIINTDKTGVYKAMLPPGNYTLQPVGGSPFPSCGTVDITVTPDTMLDVDLSCDTGIR